MRITSKNTEIVTNKVTITPETDGEISIFHSFDYLAVIGTVYAEAGFFDLRTTLIHPPIHVASHPPQARMTKRLGEKLRNLAVLSLFCALVAFSSILGLFNFPVMRR